MDKLNSLLAVPSDFKEKLDILHAVDRPLRDIKITDFCKRVGITRKHFYKLFQSKYDIVFWYCDICNQMGINQVGRTLGWREAIKRQLSLLDEEHGFLVRESASSKGDGFFDENQLRAYNKRINTLVETLRDYRDLPVSIELNAEIRLYAEYEGRLMRAWILGESGLDIDSFADFWEDCVPGRLRESIDIKER